MAPSLHFLGLFFFYFNEHLICFAKQWNSLWKLRTRSLIFCLHHKNFFLSVFAKGKSSFCMSTGRCQNDSSKFPLITVINCTAENIVRNNSKGQLSEMSFFLVFLVKFTWIFLKQWKLTPRCDNALSSCLHSVSSVRLLSYIHCIWWRSGYWNWPWDIFIWTGHLD